MENKYGMFTFNCRMKWIEKWHKWHMLTVSGEDTFFDFSSIGFFEGIRRRALLFLIELLGGGTIIDCKNIKLVFPNLSKMKNKQYTIGIREVKE